MNGARHEQHALIIGAGPSGLFCANTLANGHWPGPVTVIDRGRPIKERTSANWQFDPRTVLCGEGGPGFLVDAKLCLSVDAGTQQHPMYGRRAMEDVDWHVYQSLLDQGHEIRRSTRPPFQIAVAKNRLSQQELTLDSYPVRPLGSDMAVVFVQSYVEKTKAMGVQFSYNTDAIEIRYDTTTTAATPTSFLVSARHGTQQVEYRCSHLFLATGWAGTEWLKTVARDLRLNLSPNNLDIGVRLEFPAFAGHQLREAGDNPKIKHYDGHSYSKTHCLVHAGRAFAFRHADDSCLVDAHTVREDLTDASSVNLLYRIHTSHCSDPWQVFREVTAVGDGNALTMELGDFMTDGHLSPPAPAFSGTLTSARECDLSQVFPERITHAIREHIRRLAKFAPGIVVRNARLYAPAAQWITPMIDVSPDFRIPNATNLWCIGDGTGSGTAGVLPAAVSGVVAARAALAKVKGDPQLKLWRFLG